MTHSNPKEAARSNKLSLSIIIPVYNGEKYLRECFDSIYNNFDDIKFSFETIIIDDGSTDDSASIYKEYSKKYKNIVYFKTDNKGVSSARNFGLEKSAGKFIMFVDCDDMLRSDWYTTIGAYIDTKYDFIFFSKYFVDKNNQKTPKYKIASYISTYNEEGIRISSPSSKIFNSRFITENKIRFKNDIINGEDLIFNLETIFRSHTYLLKKASFYIIRHNRESSTNKINEEIIDSEIKFNNEVRNIAKQYNVENVLKEENSFFTSIRTLILRSGRAATFEDAKWYYEEILNNNFFREGLLKYKQNAMSGKVIFGLLKLKRYFFLYCLAKLKNRQNDNLLEEL